jgi:hypothetical protein
MRIHQLSLTIVTCALALSTLASSHAAPAQTEQAEVDRTVVQRFDPFKDELIAVPAAEIKPGFLYNRYSERMGRRVWSLALPGGGFEYAMAPGSTQPARLLDLRATEAQMREELLERAPELAQVLDVRGGTAFVRLMPDNTWQVVQQPTIASVFDLETSRRWEWHGVRRVAVLHTLGYEWSVVDGQFVPGITSIAGVSGYVTGSGSGYAAGSRCW